MSQDHQLAIVDDAYQKAELQRFIRPGRAMFALHSTYGTWYLPKQDSASLRSCIEKLSRDGKVRISSEDELSPYFKLKPKMDKKYIEVDFLVGKKLYLDACTMKIEKEDSDDGLYLSYTNESTGYYPLTARYPTLFGIIFAFFPFYDYQMTKKSMLWLKKLVDEDLGIESKMTCKRYIG